MVRGVVLALSLLRSTELSAKPDKRSLNKNSNYCRKKDGLTAADPKREFFPLAPGIKRSAMKLGGNLLSQIAVKERKTTKSVFCNILEHEIQLSRCSPVKEFRKCKLCDGYVLKRTAKAKRKSRSKKVPVDSNCSLTA